MEEIKISIDVLLAKKQELEITIDNFSKNGRSPNDGDYLKMIGLLDVWKVMKYQIEVLQNSLESIIHNNKFN
jgi:hypothetical protein